MYFKLKQKNGKNVNAAELHMLRNVVCIVGMTYISNAGDTGSFLGSAPSKFKMFTLCSYVYFTKNLSAYGRYALLKYIRICLIVTLQRMYLMIEIQLVKTFHHILFLANISFYKYYSK